LSFILSVVMGDPIGVGVCEVVGDFFSVIKSEALTE
jgi:hypothetical protein